MIKYITNPIHSLTQSNTAATITSLLSHQLLTRTLQPVPPGQSSIENDAQGIKKLLLKTQVSLISLLHSEVNQLIQHTHISSIMIHIRCFLFNYINTLN